MTRLGRPWAGAFLSPDTPFGPGDCLLSEVRGGARQADSGRVDRCVLMRGQSGSQTLFLHPYPKRATAKNPDRHGFPVRPVIGAEPHTEDERQAHALLRQMNEVQARVQELNEALDDPEHLWPRLRAAWDRAQNEEDPRMAEIVRHARQLGGILRDLEHRIRRVLRRTRELTPLGRVREMDRTAMVWLSRQPGHSLPQRAGASQRILSTVRREDFDTLENRVLHAYVHLASAVAREWLRANDRACESRRFRQVESYRKTCAHVARHLVALGVRRAEAGVTPNYVLTQDRGYRSIYDGWLRLLRQNKALDNLWAWQAQTWTDFSVLAIILALEAVPGSELVAQSPVVWREEAQMGRWFDQDRPLAVFWLRDSGRIVEVLARPGSPAALLMAARAHVALRITDIAQKELSRLVAVWTPHAMERLNLEKATDEALARLTELQEVTALDILRKGLILTPAHGAAEERTQRAGAVGVTAIAMGAAGADLALGLAALGRFMHGDFYRGAP